MTGFTRRAGDGGIELIDLTLTKIAPLSGL